MEKTQRKEDTQRKEKHRDRTKHRGRRNTDSARNPFLFLRKTHFIKNGFARKWGPDGSLPGLGQVGALPGKRRTLLRPDRALVWAQKWQERGPIAARKRQNIANP